MKLAEVKKPNTENLYSSKEVSEFMGISTVSLFRLVKGGKIKVLDIAQAGSKRPIWRFRAEYIQDYYDSIQRKIDWPTREGDSEINP